MEAIKTIMKYVLYALAIIVGFPFLAYIILNCLALGLINPLFSILIILLIIITLIICKNTKSKKLKAENEQLKEKAEKLERQLHIEKIVKESDAKRGH